MCAIMNFVQLILLRWVPQVNEVVAILRDYNCAHNPVLFEIL